MSTVDQFCWDNAKLVEGSFSSNPRWRCNHCGEEYPLSVRSIRNHLAGEGNDIIPCPKVDPQIREVAKKKRSDLAAAPVQALAVKREADDAKIAVTPTGANHGETSIITNSSITSLEAADCSDFRTLFYEKMVPGDVDIVVTTGGNHGEASGMTDSTITSVKAPAGETLGRSDLSDFCWDNVEVLPDDPLKWICKHCRREIPLTVEGIRNHLSGEGNDISSCDSVPRQIRMEALLIGRPMRRPLSITLKLCPSMKDKKEIVLDTLVKFLLHRNVSINTITDLNLKGLLKMIAKRHTTASQLLQDAPDIMQGLLYSKCKRKVDAYIQEAKESWKTGCTYIFYNLNDGRENMVCGWYSLKGFFFTGVSEFVNIIGGCERNRMYVQCIGHPRMTTLCHYHAFDLHPDKNIRFTSMWCVQDRIQGLCRDICKIEWVEDLIEKSKKIYTYLERLSPSSRYWIQAEFKKTDQHRIILVSSSFTLTIMHLKVELKRWLSDVTEDGRTTLECDDGDTEIISIINSDEFWCEGGKLQDILESLIRIYDLVDTLAPTAGYLLTKVTELKQKMEKACDPAVSKYRMLWECYEEYLGDITSEKEATFSYLNPAYISTKPQESLTLTDAGKIALRNIVLRAALEELRATLHPHKAIDAEVDANSNRSTNPPLSKVKFSVLKHHAIKALDVEVEAYSNRSTNPLANIPSSESNNHPLELWEKYGGDQFPLLKLCAIKLMSRPVSCMCNQVKKQMSQIHGLDNWILRLNYKMMIEFKNMRDRIFAHP